MTSEKECPVCGRPFSGKDHESCIGCLVNLTKIDRDSIDIDKMVEDVIEMVGLFTKDIAAAFAKDPAANNIMEVLTSYPGVQAILLHRIANFLHSLSIPYIPRFLSHVNRALTQIEIHPGAKIGTDFFIDHGGGVVIGETARIGNNVTVYQGVTIGGTSLEKGKRHPTIGDDVIIGAGAKILGPIKIGNRVKIGANAVVTKDIPSDSVVVGVPGRVVSRNNQPVSMKELCHGDLPDPIRKMLYQLMERIDALEKRVDTYQGDEQHETENL